ncbi:MAG: hypothetical protein JWM93_2803 [Frankiales bacterium]|nr:hypothetical protein [Frankiales bacterium]
MITARRLPAYAAFTVLAAAWWAANMAGMQAAGSAWNRATALLAGSSGRPLASGNSWGTDWAGLSHGLLPLVAAAVLAVVLRRHFAGAWFLAALALPLAVPGGWTLHGLWRPGPGLDAYTYGATMGSRTLNLVSYGAGPSWVVWAGTALSAAVVVVPAMLVPVGERLGWKRASAAAARTLPAALGLAVVTAVAFGLAGVVYHGGDTATLMVTGAVAVLGISVVSSALLAGEPSRGRFVAVAAIAAPGTAAVLSPNARLVTDIEVAAAAIAVVAIVAALQTVPWRTLRARLNGFRSGPAATVGHS